ncbi:MAG: CHAT domain-containing protein [Cyanobacteria bacterium P01_A01_bin.105]
MAPHHAQGFQRKINTLFHARRYQGAVDTAWQAIQLHRQLADALAESQYLYHLGMAHQQQGHYPQAELYYQRALALLPISTPGSPDARELKADILNNLGFIYQALDQNQRAEPLLVELIEFQQNRDTPSTRYGQALTHLALVRQEQGKMTEALALLEQAFWGFLQERDIGMQAAVLLNIGTVHAQLGQYEAADRAFEQAYRFVKGNRYYYDFVSIALGNRGMVQALRGNHDQALSLYDQAIDIWEQDQQQVARSVSRLSRWLNEVAYVQLARNELPQALSTFEEALAIAHELGTADEKIDIYSGIGLVQAKQSEVNPAWESHSRALRVAIAAQNHVQTITAVRYTAELLQVEHPELAIAFYKQAINQIETIRIHLRTLPLETQKRYTDTVSSSYRHLAALLLQQNRVFEAQQVLDLLKIQELESYLQNVRADRPGEKLPYLPAEQTLLDRHQHLLLEDFTELNPVISLNRFLTDPVVADALHSLQRAGQDNSLQPDSLKTLQQSLQSLPDHTVVLYPLVLEDRLELLLVTAKGMPLHHTAPINKAQLKAKISELRQQLELPSGTVKPIAGDLYDWLIRPFQIELTNLGIDNIIYIPDSVLHYVPLSVLYDHQTNQWLLEQYSSHNLTASSVGDIAGSPDADLQVLAGAFTDAQPQPYHQPIGDQTVPFYGLTYAKQEVDFLQRMLPETVILQDTDFTHRNLQTQLQEQNILHLATHAAFVPGRPEDSFILLGDGDVITMDELRHWSLPNVDLVVLSACQTAIGHIEDGLEILGMGFQLQRTEAAATLASLWRVDDRYAAWLMQAFYTHLDQGLPKAEALRQAQLTLIQQGRPEPSHWAAFVIIGNGR